eukprot:TRINITY_DN3643_c0_g1_i5.p1 TRINITY_DN3643_c0_g1~~TRINITY_DN3643_c0_g1_i5.p1  ORF type:complete len:326 (-),score=57.53 TRINITY_DN3643_c0_g1_i5:43-1020(-)
MQTYDHLDQIECIQDGTIQSGSVEAAVKGTQSNKRPKKQHHASENRPPTPPSRKPYELRRYYNTLRTLYPSSFPNAEENLPVTTSPSSRRSGGTREVAKNNFYRTLVNHIPLHSNNQNHNKHRLSYELFAASPLGLGPCYDLQDADSSPETPPSPTAPPSISPCTRSSPGNIQDMIARHFPLLSSARGQTGSPLSSPSSPLLQTDSTCTTPSSSPLISSSPLAHLFPLSHSPRSLSVPMPIALAPASLSCPEFRVVIPQIVPEASPITVHIGPGRPVEMLPPRPCTIEGLFDMELSSDLLFNDEDPFSPWPFTSLGAESGAEWSC